MRDVVVFSLGVICQVLTFTLGVFVGKALNERIRP